MTTQSTHSEEREGRSIRGRLITFLLIIFILGVVGLGLFFRFLSVYIGPGEFGIKQVNIGFLIWDEGIQERVYDSGYTFRIPVIQTIHLFPRQLQVLEFTDKAQTHMKFRHYEQAVNIQTSDGYYVRVDLSLIYKIVDPYRVITTLGPQDKYLTRGILPEAEPILRQKLGELTTEEFYNSPMRVAKAETAREVLNSSLEKEGLVVDAVLIRYFQYSDQIQKNIEEKKLKDQLVYKNQAEARAAIEEANLKKVIEEGEAAVRVRLEEGQAYVTQRTAETERYVRERKAEANLLVQLAEAQRTKLKNEAMTGQGAQRLVGLEMADVLEGIEFILIPSDGTDGYNPLNLKQTLDYFEVNK
ncbi:SPFH domain-containing protein [bacterium]|nr:SPFH domain-containing protein [bacterium]